MNTKLGLSGAGGDNMMGWRQW